MRWKDLRQSENVEDRRARGPARKVAVGGGLGVLVLALIALLLGGDPQALLSQLDSGAISASGDSGYSAGGAVEADPAEDEARRFVGAVLASTEDVWNNLFARSGESYREPVLVLFRDQVESACGFQSAAVGPFYCPGDDKVYLDLVFFEELSRKLGAPGDFAQAYVVAHEVGHHIQNLLGTSVKVQQEKREVSVAEGNQLSVRLELQADFLAGCWAHHAQATQRFLEPGDIDEALNAASQIGDDTLQRRSSGRVMPESFTHGTAAQRVRWFRLGFETGDLGRMNDTFSVRYEEL